MKQPLKFQDGFMPELRKGLRPGFKITGMDILKGKKGYRGIWFLHGPGLSVKMDAYGQSIEDLQENITAMFAEENNQK